MGRRETISLAVPESDTTTKLLDRPPPGTDWNGEVRDDGAHPLATALPVGGDHHRSDLGNAEDGLVACWSIDPEEIDEAVRATLNLVGIQATARWASSSER
jgi:hypothetical protein